MTAGEVTVEPVTGTALRDLLPALALLRIEVFRDFPYLYDGTLGYEQRYIAEFAAAADTVVVVAKAGEEIVGMATASPMLGHADAFAEPFRERGYDVDRLFYCGESVLKRTYRGRGIGHAFFDHREAHGRALGRFTHVTFCGVVRPPDHPLRPPDYRPLDGFWRKRGYLPLDGVRARFSWKDIDKSEADEKEMQFWIRPL
ncbi:MAG: GNAT family N-acetyltransferase [Hyphomicrobiaceae bacterium]